MIKVKNLTKRYGNKVAVNDASFTIEKGEIVGFLGPNGAGKSTTMNIITGFLSSSEGSVEIDGIDILENPIEAKKRIGYLPETPPLCLDMTVNEYLDFVYGIKKADLNNKDEALDKIIKLVKIDDVQKRLIKNLSKGYKQRVGLAQALVGNPPVLILDEPTSGLDPKQIIDVRNLIKSLGDNHTIIISSHILTEVNAICDRVIIINDGELVAKGTPETLAQGLNSDGRIAMTIEAPTKKLLRLIKNIDKVKDVTIQSESSDGVVDIIVQGKANADIRRSVFRALSKANYPILQMRSMGLALEDIFLQVTENNKGV